MTIDTWLGIVTEYRYLAEIRYFLFDTYLKSVNLHNSLEINNWSNLFNNGMANWIFGGTRRTFIKWSIGVRWALKYINQTIWHNIEMLYAVKRHTSKQKKKNNKKEKRVIYRSKLLLEWHLNNKIHKKIQYKYK